MKYSCSVEINAPLKKVVQLWADENNFKEWQDGFVKIKHLSGEVGAAGSTSKIYLDDGKRKMELFETILINNLPTERKAEYEHIHMTNTQKSSFEALTDNRTRYTSEVEYTKFNGFMPKMMAKLFPSLFKKQSQKWMNQFKTFVENQ